MPVKFPLWAVPCASAFLLVACAAQPVFVPLSPTHPASPWACESPMAPRSNTLAINSSEIVPPHPDWQIAGMRDNELHGHAAGQPNAMDMMGHGHMMMHGGGKSQKAPGMIKMSAPADKVDYVPKNAKDPKGPEPAEHQPESHLDHTDPDRKAAGYVAAPIAPPMDHMSGMDHKNMDHKDMGNMEGMDHQSMDHTKEMDHKDMDPKKIDHMNGMDHKSMDHMKMDQNESGKAMESEAKPAAKFMEPMKDMPAEDHTKHEH